MPKLRYEFDPHNRLVAGLCGMRRVLEGQFRIGPRNALTYDIKTPIPEGIKAPHQLKLKGEWSLDKDHRLRFVLDKWQRQTFGDQLTIQSEILDVKKNALLFAVTTRNQKGNSSIYALELSGAWQADSRNRLTFRVNKGGDNFNTLELSGAWQIDKSYQVIYRYAREDLVRKRKRVHTLAFKGCWEISDKARLSYIIDKNSDSVFNFKTSVGIFKGNYVKYELGIGLSEKKQPVKRTITLFGSWKIKKGVGLVFEIEAGNKIQAIVLGAQARLGEKNTVAFRLRNNLNKDIFGELELARDIFQGDGQVFLRLLEERGEMAIQAGAGWKW
jgi:hypothetical protein